MPATVSALMLYVWPSAPTPIGAMTGMKFPSSSVSTTSGLTDSISPTWPMSMVSSPASGFACCKTNFRARIKSPSLPERPTARPPCEFTSATISLLTSPPSTISTISMVSRSVTLRPSTNSLFLPIRSSRLPICGPPPCTTTGFMPTSFISVTSRANPRFNCSSTMALPPYLITMVLP